MSRHSTVWGIFAGALTALLWVMSIPPFEFAEAANIHRIQIALLLQDWDLLHALSGFRFSVTHDLIAC